MLALVCEKSCFVGKEDNKNHYMLILSKRTQNNDIRLVMKAPDYKTPQRFVVPDTVYSKVEVGGVYDFKMKLEGDSLYARIGDCVPSKF